MSAESPSHGLPAPGTRRLLVVGDLILDEFLRGEVARLSPEAPVPVLEPQHSQAALGGAANVAANLAALGAQVTLVGAVGDDAAGRQLPAMCAAAGLQTDHLVVAAGRPTSHKLRLVAQVQHLLRIDREVCGPYPASVRQALTRAVDRALPEVDAVVLSDYRKGLLDDALVAHVIAAAAAAGVPVAVDPKGADFGRYRGATYLTPNRRELEAACGAHGGGAAGLDAAAAVALAQTGARALLVTCGAAGMVVYDGGPGRRIAAEAREVFDVTGAGDTVVAAFALAACAGTPPAVAARLANTAAGLAVAKLGTATVEHGELAAACGAAVPACSKSLSWAAATAEAARLRATGRRLVFTNGCFDLLHAGHVRYLQAARAEGDALWVGLNSDASVRGLKGSTRPLVPERERACVLEALACVDAVVVFEQSTPLQLVTALQPHVLVKGADYEGREVVGRPVVEAAGGRVVLVPMMAQQSTSRLVQRIVQACGGRPARARPHTGDGDEPAHRDRGRSAER